MRLRIRLCAALLASLLALPAMAEGLHSYAAPAYDARHGGQQVNIDALLTDPGAFYRSEAAYANARAIIGSMVGMNLTESNFANFLASEDVSVVRCEDVFSSQEFTLAAVDDTGTGYWASPRTCDAGEMIVMYGAMPIMSLACLNPIRPEIDCPCGTVYWEWREEHPEE